MTIGQSDLTGLRLVQVRIHFEALYVRYLWPLVRPQYSPPESCLTLHNPLGLSQGLKSCSTSPQNGTKAAAIAMQFNRKMGIMRQSPSCRTRYVFSGIKMSDIESPQNLQKNQPARTVLTQQTIAVLFTFVVYNTITKCKANNSITPCP